MIIVRPAIEEMSESDLDAKLLRMLSSGKPHEASENRFVWELLEEKQKLVFARLEPGHPVQAGPVPLLP